MSSEASVKGKAIEWSDDSTIPGFTTRAGGTKKHTWFGDILHNRPCLGASGSKVLDNQFYKARKKALLVSNYYPTKFQF